MKVRQGKKHGESTSTKVAQGQIEPDCCGTHVIGFGAKARQTILAPVMPHDPKQPDSQNAGMLTVDESL